jgi:hypothetical protein
MCIPVTADARRKEIYLKGSKTTISASRFEIWLGYEFQLRHSKLARLLFADEMAERLVPVISLKGNYFS